MEKVSQVTGLLDSMAAKIKDNRTQSLIDHNKLRLVKQCVLLTVTGNPDTNDADQHRLDAALAEALGVDENGSEELASQPTVSRFLNSLKKADLDGLADWLLEFYLRNHATRPRRLYLYADGTAVECHGKQEGAIYRAGKYKKEMLFPLTIFDHAGWLLAAKLRPGNKSEAKTIVEVLEWLVGKLRERWSNVEIVLIVDGAFRSSRLLNWCEKNKVFYLAGTANTFAVQMKVKEEAAALAKSFEKSHGKPRFLGNKGEKKSQEEHARIRAIEDARKRMEEEKALSQRRLRYISEDMYRATTWPKEDPDRRIIFKLDYTDKGLETRCVLTNFTCYTAEQIYKMYCQRGTSETWIGEFKNCFNLRFNSQSFHANQFRLYIHAAAYMLLWLLRSFCSPSFHNRSLMSLQKIFVLVPVAATFKPRRTLWELSDRYPYQTEFLRLTRKLQARAS